MQPPLTRGLSRVCAICVRERISHEYTTRNTTDSTISGQSVHFFHGLQSHIPIVVARPLRHCGA